MSTSRHYNGSSANGKAPTPKFQFRGVFLPAEVVQRMVDGQLNRTDILVLTLVEALVEPRGRDCWASNEYIADAIGVHPMNVSKSIRKLTKAGLLIMAGKTSNRTLRTAWSRAVPETPTLSENAYSTLSENAYSLPYNNKALESPPRGAGERVRPAPPLNGKTPTSKQTQSNKANAVHTSGYRLAKEVLYPGLRDAGRIVTAPHLPSWGKTLDKLLARVKVKAGLNGNTAAYVKAVMKDHVAHVKDKYQPQALSAEAFARKFDDIVAARDRRRRHVTDDETGFTVPDEFLGEAPSWYTPEMRERHRREEAAEDRRGKGGRRL